MVVPYFNVEEFNTTIQKRIEMAQTFEQTLTNISREISNVQACIGNQENQKIYSLWENLKANIAKIQEKFVTKNQELITELKNYKAETLKNNDLLYQSISRTDDKLESLSSQIDAL